MKILIIRFSSIGDIVLTSPVIRSIKTEYPNAEIHYITKASFESVLAHHPHIQKLWLYQKGNLNALIAQLKQENFDVVIDLHSNLRSRYLSLRLNKKTHRFDKLNIKKWLYVKLKLKVLPNIHIVDRYLATLKALNVTTVIRHLDYFLPNGIEHQIPNQLSEVIQKPFVAFVLGGQHATKRIPLEKCIEIIDQINLPVVLLGGKDEQSLAQDIKDKLFEKEIHHAAGLLSLNASAFLIKKSTKVITGDTGLMHIAAAFQKPIASVWGNTVPEFGMYPYGVFQQKQFQVEGLGCRPCSKLGYQACPKTHFACMKEQNAHAIAQWINQS
jgi:ADP-heptose:LPS heptosyltransferase